MLPAFFHAPILGALNALLVRESWARERLRPHAGKPVRLDVGGFELALQISSGGNVHLHADATPAVKVTVARGDIGRLLSRDPRQRMQAVHIEGEAALTHVVSELARDLRWDVEDELAQLLGDLPASLLISRLRQVLLVAQDSGTRLAQNATEYATYEAHLLVNRDQLAGLQADIQRLDADIDACAERLANLRRQLGR